MNKYLSTDDIVNILEKNTPNFFEKDVGFFSIITGKEGYKRTIQTTQQNNVRLVYSRYEGTDKYYAPVVDVWFAPNDKHTSDSIVKEVLAELNKFTDGKYNVVDEILSARDSFLKDLASVLKKHNKDRQVGISENELALYLDDSFDALNKLKIRERDSLQRDKLKTKPNNK